MDKDKHFAIIGSVDAGKSAYTQAVIKAMETQSIPFVITKQGVLSNEYRYTKRVQEDIIAKIKEWQLIQQKKSKLSRAKRDAVERKINYWIKNETITLKDLEL